jgi:redox-sensing transcriptional repressor
MPRHNVPDVVVRRLPLYLQTLNHIAETGQQVVSSTELGRTIGVSSAQIRKDLSYFGAFGKQRVGYEVDHLRAELKRILQLDEDWHVLIVGAGALGHALANYRAFEEQHFVIVAVLDNDPAKTGQPIGPLVVQPMESLAELVRERHVEIAILAVPARAAQSVADQLIASGVRSILCYAPITLSVPEGVHVAYIDPVTTLQTMTYYL